MKFRVYQQIMLRDFNDEIITEMTYDHGEFSLPWLSPGVSLITPALGLKGFEIVIDPRLDAKKYKVIDIALPLLEPDKPAQVYLEPMTLIIGQHDIGNL